MAGQWLSFGLPCGCDYAVQPRIGSFQNSTTSSRRTNAPGVIKVPSPRRDVISGNSACDGKYPKSPIPAVPPPTCFAPRVESSTARKRVFSSPKKVLPAARRFGFQFSLCEGFHNSQNGQQSTPGGGNNPPTKS